MAYESVDKLQKALAQSIFNYAKDPKKAAGRALGTLVEIITFYLLQSWELGDSIAIEKSLAEYGNPEITHNVEYSLHPVLHKYSLTLPDRLPITAARILSAGEESKIALEGFDRTTMKLLSAERILRNSCHIAKGKRSSLVALLDSQNDLSEWQLTVLEQFSKPFAMFECKRVGIEETSGKGPQTIEKAKQGSYVAKSVSSLHKLRLASGQLRGLVYKSDGSIYSKPYVELIREIISSNDPELLRDFILTVGVVSNHGNWFTAENQNKEMKVLVQSYDWLIFLTDEGLAEFITDLLLAPSPLLKSAQKSFRASYRSGKRKNQFTKVQMDYDADRVLRSYFRENSSRIARWFNVIGPKDGTVEDLKLQISQLHNKDWRAIHLL